MKNTITLTALIFVLLCSFSSRGQKTDSLAKVQKQSEHLQNYRKAIGYNDMSTAASSLIGYLNAGGTENYLDTLAIVYYNLNNFNGAYKLANELYSANNKNSTALTLLADISGRGGETKTSLEWYEKLVVLTPSPYNYYQLATKQYLLERKLECRQSLQKVIADSAEAVKQPVSMEVSNGYFEQVPALAAAYNMLGVLAFNEKKNDEAEAYYKKAIALAPDFVIGKQNLESLKPKNAAKQPGKTAAPAKAKG
jgi:tetratricopeptide (TPR) repeat protein